MGNRYDLNIKQGETFTRAGKFRTSDGVAVNLTGYTIRAQIRTTYAAVDPPMAALTCSITDGPAGAFQFALTATQTAALAATGPGQAQRPFYVWDLEIENSGTVTRLLEGQVYVSPEVTR